MIQPILPLLAADLQPLIAIVILVISICSWIVNLLKDQKANAPQPRNRKRPANSGQSTLDRFLEEVEKRNEPKQNRPGAARPGRPESNDKKKAKQRTTTGPGAPAPPAPEKTQSNRLGSRLGQGTLLPSSGLGEGVRSHVASHLETRNVDSQVERDVDAAVQRDIDSKVQTDIGTNFGKDSTRTAQRTESVHPMIQMLRNPQGVRQAILMTEILKRPRSISSARPNESHLIAGGEE